jgi:hypothetical protein
MEVASKRRAIKKGLPCNPAEKACSKGPAAIYFFGPGRIANRATL